MAINLTPINYPVNSFYPQVINPGINPKQDPYRPAILFGGKWNYNSLPNAQLKCSQQSGMVTRDVIFWYRVSDDFS